MKQSLTINILLVFILSLGFARFLPAQSQSDSLELLITSSKGIEKTKLLNRLASLYLETNLDTALSVATKAFSQAQNYDDQGEIAKATRTLADAWFYLNDLNKAIEFYKLSAEAEKERNGPQSKAYGVRLADIAYCFNALSQYDLAQEFYNHALEVAKNNNDIEETANNLNNLGHNCFAYGNYSIAISYFSQALALDKERQIDEYISVDLNNIGKVYFSWKKYDRAIEYYREALEKANITGNESMQAIRLSNIGQAYEALNEYDSAMYYLNKALIIDRKLGKRGKEGIRLSHVGLVFLKQQQYAASLQIFQEAQSIFEDLGKISSQAIVLNHLGDLMLLQENYNEALSYFRSSIEISASTNLRAEKLKSLKGLSDVYYHLDDTQRSFDYFKQFTQLKDSIFNEEKHRQIAEFETRYETNKKEQENTLLKQEARIQENQKTILLITISATLIVTALFFLFVYHQTKIIDTEQKTS